MDTIIYVDNNATTAVAPEVFEEMKPYFTELYGNPSSMYRFGGELGKDIEIARNKVADLIGSTYRDKDNKSSEILFTSCGTESDNAAILSALQLSPEKRKIVVSEVEHPAVLSLCKDIQRKGYIIELIPVDKKGKINLADVEKAVDANTAIVSVMWANNEIGNIYPVNEIAKIAHKNGALFHTDAVQAVGKVPINMDENEIDLLSLSGHKLHAPKGIGALYIRRGTRFRPFIIGGHQESSRRAGTENIAGIVALGKACELAKENIENENIVVKQLRDSLETKIAEQISDIRINGDFENRLPNTASISFEYIEGEAILMLLDQFNICASSGSACTTGSLEPSHVLRAMGLPYTAAHGTIRFSFSRYNTQADVDFIVEKLPPVIAKLREYSPFWQDRNKK